MFPSQVQFRMLHLEHIARLEQFSWVNSITRQSRGQYWKTIERKCVCTEHQLLMCCGSHCVNTNADDGIWWERCMADTMFSIGRLYCDHIYIHIYTIYIFFFSIFISANNMFKNVKISVPVKERNILYW